MQNDLLFSCDPVGSVPVDEWESIRQNQGKETPELIMYKL